MCRMARLELRDQFAQAKHVKRAAKESRKVCVERGREGGREAGRQGGRERRGWGAGGGRDSWAGGGGGVEQVRGSRTVSARARQKDAVKCVWWHLRGGFRV